MTSRSSVVLPVPGGPLIERIPPSARRRCEPDVHQARPGTACVPASPLAAGSGSGPHGSPPHPSRPPRPARTPWSCQGRARPAGRRPDGPGNPRTLPRGCGRLQSQAEPVGRGALRRRCLPLVNVGCCSAWKMAVWESVRTYPMPSFSFMQPGPVNAVAGPFRRMGTSMNDRSLRPHEQAKPRHALPAPRQTRRLALPRERNRRAGGSRSRLAHPDEISACGTSHMP